MGYIWYSLTRIVDVKIALADLLFHLCFDAHCVAIVIQLPSNHSPTIPPLGQAKNNHLLSRILQSPGYYCIFWVRPTLSTLDIIYPYPNLDFRVLYIPNIQNGTCSSPPAWKTRNSNNIYFFSLSSSINHEGTSAVNQTSSVHENTPLPYRTVARQIESQHLYSPRIPRLPQPTLPSIRHGHTNPHAP